MEQRCKTPIALIFFNRPDTLAMVFERVRAARPEKLFLIQDGPRNENDVERRKDLEYLLKSAQNTTSAKDFLESYKLEPDEDSKENNEPKITLITVHSAKGTEADVCFLLHAQSGSFPHIMAENDDEIEEERRILYVAITRARKRLYLSRTADGDSGFINFEMETMLDKNNKLALRSK